MVQQAAAAALERGDRGLTQADLFNIPLVPLPGGIPLLTPERVASPGVAVEVCMPDGHTCFFEDCPIGTGHTALDHEQLLICLGPYSPISPYAWSQPRQYLYKDLAVCSSSGTSCSQQTRGSRARRLVRRNPWSGPLPVSGPSLPAATSALSARVTADHRCPRCRADA